MATTLKPNLNEIKNFKKYFHETAAAIYLAYPPKDGKCLRPESLYGSAKANIARLVEANIEGMSIAMMINKGMVRSIKAVTKVSALFADFDSGDLTIANMLALPIEPHMIIESSPSKFHVYWLVKDCQVDQFSAVMKALALKLGSDTNICDLVRVMRMPGSINWKYNLPFLTKIVHQQKDAKPILLKVFIEEMELKVDVVAEKPVTNVADHGSLLTVELVTEIKAALADIPQDDRAVWRKVGMAIHGMDQSERGYDLWTEWSKASDKFKDSDQRKNWDKFAVGKGVSINSLFWLAHQYKRVDGFKYDEGALANLLAESFNKELRYDPDNKQWYRFNGVVWIADAQAPIRCVRDMTHALSYEKKEDEVDNSIHKFRTVAAFKAIVNHAELMPGLHISLTDFDKNPNLLAVMNGVIDLSTGQFRPAASKEYLRRQTKVVFDDKAECPEWIKFMKAITCQDRELYEFIRRVMGYILFGHANLQFFFLALGSGSNGKGVLMRTLKALLGEYAASVSPSLLTSAYSGNANAPTPALAVLCGVRFVICTELTGRKLDGAFIKQFSGADDITARHGYGGVFTFKPEGKLFLSANYEDLPELSATDEAMWRRLIPIPFNAKFTKLVNDDEKLDEKLAMEFPGILNWLLKGAKAYIENKHVGSCAAVDDLKQELRNEADSLLAWMSEFCVKSTNAKTQASVAFESYMAFMKNRGKKALTVQAFRAGLENKGLVHKRSSGNNYYAGFRIHK